MNAHDIERLWVGATRYYLGRMTADTHSYCAQLIGEWWWLPRSLRDQIQRDVEREFERDDEWRKNDSLRPYPLGMDCDREAWERVRGLWRGNTPSSGAASAISDKNPCETPVNDGKCRKCGGTMRPGKALVNGWSGSDDMGEVCTVSADPKLHKLIDCMKCEKCGWSVSIGADGECVNFIRSEIAGMVK